MEKKSLLKFDDFSKTIKPVKEGVFGEEYKNKFDELFKEIDHYFNSEQSLQCRKAITGAITQIISFEPDSRFETENKLQLFSGIIDIVKKDLKID